MGRQAPFQHTVFQCGIATDDDRVQPDLDETVVTVKGRCPDDTLSDFRRRPGRLLGAHMEDEVSEAVEDRPAAIDLDRLQDRRTVADKERRARIDAGAGDTTHPVRNLVPVGRPMMMVQIGDHQRSSFAAAAMAARFLSRSAASIRAIPLLGDC